MNDEIILNGILFRKNKDYYDLYMYNGVCLEKVGTSGKPDELLAMYIREMLKDKKPWLKGVECLMKN